MPGNLIVERSKVQHGKKRDCRSLLLAHGLSVVTLVRKILCSLISALLQEFQTGTYPTLAECIVIFTAVALPCR